MDNELEIVMGLRKEKRHVEKIVTADTDSRVL